MPAKSSQPEPSSAPEPDETGAAADEVEVPMNRAERRAKGKSAGKPQVVGKITPSHVNNNHGPRSYANRRSG